MAEQRKIKKIAFAGGGSGGHIYPLMAIATEIQKLSPQTGIFFVSTRGSVEEKIVPRGGYRLLLIPSGKLNGQNPFVLLKTFFALFLSIFVCLKILIKENPDLIMSGGGYAGAPFLFLGALLGKRCEIFEQNRIPGLANRWMAKVCSRIFLNFEGSKAEFSGKNVASCGHPCRTEIEAALWSEQDWETGMKSTPFRIFVFGGSQGAVGINRLVSAAAKLLSSADFRIVHQTGEVDFEQVKSDYAASGFTNVRIEKYIHDMAAEFRSAHLVISRAGASSLAELAAAGKASILIPLVSKDRHQEYNASEIEKLGAGKCFFQKQLTGEKLAEVLNDFQKNREQLKALSVKMGSMHRPNAARNIAQKVLEVDNGL